MGSCYLLPLLSERLALPFSYLGFLASVPTTTQKLQECSLARKSCGDVITAVFVDNDAYLDWFACMQQGAGAWEYGT